MKWKFRLSRQVLMWVVILGLLPLGLLLLANVVGSGPADRLWTNAPGWSRAKLIATTDSTLKAAQPVAITVDNAGVIYLLLTHKNGTNVQPRIVALNRQTEVIWDRSFDVAAQSLQQAQLLVHNTQLTLFWINQQQLYTAQLDDAGSVQRAPTRLSGSEVVDSYSVARNAQGAITVWYGGSHEAPGIYAVPAGDATGKPNVIDSSGMRPNIQYDHSGRLHAVWLNDQSGIQDGPYLYHAVYADGARAAGEQQVLVKLNLSGATLDELWFGLDQKNGYVFWTTSVTSGMSAGAVITQYVSFALDAPARVSPVRALDVPDGAALPYQPFQGGELHAGPRVDLASYQSLARIAPTKLFVNPQTRAELVVACKAQILYKNHQTVAQVGAIFFQNGSPRAYQLISFSPNNTFAPFIVSDTDAYLYTTWLELADSGLNVYVASTAPDIKQALDTLTMSDFSRIGFDVSFGLISGALFAPFAAVLWSFAPLLMLAATWFVRRERQSLSHWGTRISLVAALIAYWVGKIITLSGAASYVPFSGWIPVIPPWLALPLQIAVPLSIFAGALWVAWRSTYRRGTQSAVLFIAIYAVVDSLCSMAIYGGLLFGAFYPAA